MSRAAALAAPVTAGLASLVDLPPLPSHLRYIDEYDDSVRTIRDLAANDRWKVQYDTHHAVLDFSTIADAVLKHTLKSATCWGFRDLSPATVVKFVRSAIGHIREKGEDSLNALISIRPMDIHSAWEADFRKQLGAGEIFFFKSFFYFLTDMRVAPWHPGHQTLIRSLQHPPAYHYAGVRSGESLLTAGEEAAVVRFLDETAAEVRRGSAVYHNTTLRHCLLALCYLHGLRPVQIGRIAFADLRIYQGVDGEPVVHFVGHRAKKRSGNERTAFVRQIKREWAPPFKAWHELRQRQLGTRAKHPTASDKAFPMNIAEICREVGDASQALMGARRTATDFRHSVAQRLADSGASVEEVSAFLGHSCLQTSLIYFDHSAAQAEQVNKALAISPVYSKLAEVARTRTIDKRALLGLPPDNQVGAVPHGVPIAGIGGCDLGQSLCEMNPALSCYSCKKFIPVSDADVHQEALDKFRRVARFFFDESRGDNQSPAFMQLRVTLTAIQSVIAQLKRPSSQEPTDA